MSRFKPENTRRGWHFTNADHATRYTNEPIPPVGVPLRMWDQYGQSKIPKLCIRGMHASPTPLDASFYYMGENLSRVVVEGSLRTSPPGEDVQKFCGVQRTVTAGPVLWEDIFPVVARKLGLDRYLDPNLSRADLYGLASHYGDPRVIEGRVSDIQFFQRYHDLESTVEITRWNPALGGMGDYQRRAAVNTAVEQAFDEIWAARTEVAK